MVGAMEYLLLLLLLLVLLFPNRVMSVLRPIAVM